MSNSKQRGFSLLELMVAMMIIAVIGTLGFKQYQKYMAKAHYIKAQDTVKTFREGLDQHYLKYAKYPDLTSWTAGVEANSILVKQSMIPANMPLKDPWGQDYEVKSGKGTYEVKCLGDPNNAEDFGPFAEMPGRISGPNSNPGAPSGDPTAAAPAPGAAPK